MYYKSSCKFTFTFFLFAFLPLGLSMWQAGSGNLSAVKIYKVRKISKIVKCLTFRVLAVKSQNLFYACKLTDSVNCFQHIILKSQRFFC